MTEDKPLSSYFLYDPCDREKTEGMHQLIQRFRRELLGNEALQNLLLNDGYEPEKRPESFLDISGPVINRNTTIYHLSFLEHYIELATKPRIVVGTAEDAHAEML